MSCSTQCLLSFIYTVGVSNGVVESGAFAALDQGTHLCSDLSVSLGFHL